MYIVIMAGGKGTRFWPRSRAARPKQLLDIISERTMIRETVERVSGLVPPERLLIVTNSLQAPLIREQLPQLPSDNVISEPVGRNTAACICLAATRIQRDDPEAVMCVLPADHYIEAPDRFCDTLQKAADVAAGSGALVTIGIVPRGPETGYGYIQYDRARETGGACRVKQFHEKPDLERARQYIASGDFAWNSGMFIWKTSVILQELAEHVPDIHETIMPVAGAWGTPRIEAAIAEAYAAVRSISIDCGVLEKAERVLTLEGDFGWNDIGSWAAVYDNSQKDAEHNVLRGDVYTVDAHGCFVHALHKTTAVVGLDNVVVVETDDAILVCSRDRSQDVKGIVEQLEKQGRRELL